jgi:aspartyl-tRNA(Asn)/glutamyl-tRNA(Gln) amidotransferase subunit A
MPSTVKDLIETAGVETAFGSPLMQGNVLSRDPVCALRMQDAGVVRLGKITVPEFAGSVLTESIRSGVKGNPRVAEYLSSGPSGVSAVAVASGLGRLRLATDGAGSLRLPASCCGVLGLKSTPGPIPHELAPDLF